MDKVPFVREFKTTFSLPDLSYSENAKEIPGSYPRMPVARHLLRDAQPHMGLASLGPAQAH